MKLLRFGNSGEEKPGIIDENGKIRDLSDVIDDINGNTISPESLDKLKSLDVSSLPEVTGNPRIGPCVNKVGKFLCIGLNFSDHAAETGLEPPEEPILFSKATSAIIGPYDNVEIPRTSTATDWEVELGVIIGKKAKYISEAEAKNYIAGYLSLIHI